MDHDKLRKEMFEISDSDYRLENKYLKKAVDRTTTDLYLINGKGITANMFIEELSELGTELSKEEISIGLKEEIVDVYLAAIGFWKTIRKKSLVNLIVDPVDPNTFDIYTTYKSIGGEWSASTLSSIKDKSEADICVSMIRNDLIFDIIKSVSKTLRYEISVDDSVRLTEKLNCLIAALNILCRTILSKEELKKIALVKINRANKKINSNSINNEYTYYSYNSYLKKEIKED